MRFVNTVEGPPPLGMPTMDAGFDIRNTFENPPTGTHLYPGIRRRSISTDADVTPAFLQGREEWRIVFEPNEIILERVHPPADTNDPDDVNYARQVLTPLRKGAIMTPLDMIPLQPMPSPIPQIPPDPTTLVRQDHIASIFYAHLDPPQDQQSPGVPPPSGQKVPVQP